VFLKLGSCGGVLLTERRAILRGPCQSEHHAKARTIPSVLAAPVSASTADRYLFSHRSVLSRPSLTSYSSFLENRNRGIVKWVSRQCAHRWVKRFDTEGAAGLEDRSSRPHHSPRSTDDATVARVLDARQLRREGPALLSAGLGVSARTISRILAGEGDPHLSACDPMTGQVIRSSRASAHRYERARPGELVHVDVKKLGRIRDGGGSRSRPRREKRHLRTPPVARWLRLRAFNGR
jgi:hypothetical protein